MTIYLYSDNDGAVEVIGAHYTTDGKLMAKVKQLAPFSDGSGKAGDVSSHAISTMFADGGMAEIISTISKFTQLQGKELEMHTNIQNSENKPIGDIVKLYNSLVPASKHVKKFRDKATALRRLTEAFAGETKKNATKKPTAAKNDSTPKAKAKPKAAVVEKAVTPPPAGQITLVGKKSSLAGKFLYKAIKENPRREGTHGWHSWNCLKDGMTYEQFILNRGGNKHLAWDIKAGHVEVRSKPKQTN